MITKIEKLLDGDHDNYILPFFWVHGEAEAVIREYMEAIHSCGIGAVCVESRPHPDFCGPQWWHDMDIILDEARKRHMKVWILDDSHFPTGYANGALENAPEELCRQGICYYSKVVKGPKKNVKISIEKILNKKNDKFSLMGFATGMGNKKRIFSGDQLLSVTAIRSDQAECNIMDLTGQVKEGKLNWVVPAGEWKICVCKLSRNCGAHRNYINMIDEKSCKVLLDAVYEPHYKHYADDFGKTIAGFFSDEPELGNGPLYSYGNVLGTDQDLPWSRELETLLENSLGTDWKNKMPYLWENDLDVDETARIRYGYMDAVTRTVEKTFSYQLGDWCRERGVEYIGHIIEDNNQHARTGTSLGHYFRGLAGQDMAGIDDIGGQVMPQGEDKPNRFMRIMKRDGEFYHYVLGKLGSSLAAIDPKKQGRTMCEIFGNYGWSEGFRLEKYLADHFMVRGVNRFVPHAFSAKEFPDPDCPPHFYAQGHNPQHRHFGSLMKYMNRICELISDGKHVAQVALLYHGEAEWTGKSMLMQKPARKLADRQIDFDILPTDIFRETDFYRTNLKHGFKVNELEYRALLIPQAQFISEVLVKAIVKLKENGILVVFIEALPEGIYDGDKSLLDEIKDSPVISLDKLVDFLDEKRIPEIMITPISDRIRYLHYINQKDIYYFVNEATDVYKGKITVPVSGEVYTYNAWDNCLETIEVESKADGSVISVEIEPYKSLIVVFDETEAQDLRTPLLEIETAGKALSWSSSWKRSLCESISYPNFKEEKEVVLPDKLAKEKPKFSGFIRYNNEFVVKEPKKTVLVITDAYEGVEVFVNGVSAGIQIVPTYRFDISELIKLGNNHISIEVSTTLERVRAASKQTTTEKLQKNKIMAPTGITGDVKIYTL